MVKGHFEINWPLIFYSFRQEAPPVLKTSNGVIDCENRKLDCPLCASRQSGIIQDSCEGGLTSECIDNIVN